MPMNPAKDGSNTYLDQLLRRGAGDVPVANRVLDDENIVSALRCLTSSRAYTHVTHVSDQNKPLNAALLQQRVEIGLRE